MKATQNKNYLLPIIIKLIAIISSIYGTIKSVTGPMSFTYFTILSNIFITVVLAVFLIRDFRAYSGKSAKISNSLYVVKFLATISITLTFLVYMFLLAPTSNEGIMASYFANGASSFCVHFLAPLLAVIDFCLFDYEFKSTGKSAIYALLPPLAYVGFVIIAGQMGMRWGNMMAPYNFINYGAPTGWFGFDLSLLSSESLGIGVFYMIVVLILIFIGIGRIFLYIKDKRNASIK